MIPINITKNLTLEDELRYIEWKFGCSEAPPSKNLERLGQLVMMSVISGSSVTVGGRHVKFTCERIRNGEVVAAMRDEMYTPRPCSDEDDFELTAWVKVGDEMRDYVIYSGKSFDTLWAVWRSWILGAGFLRDMDKVDEEAKEAKEAKNAKADS